MTHSLCLRPLDAGGRQRHGVPERDSSRSGAGARVNQSGTRKPGEGAPDSPEEREVMPAPGPKVTRQPVDTYGMPQAR